MKRHAGGFRTTAALFGAAVVFNYPWEMAQSVLFEPMGTVAQASWRCFVASLGDGLMIVAIHIGGWVVFCRLTWFGRLSGGRIVFTVAAGMLIGIGIEWWGLSAGRWQYRPTMPRAPGLGLALLPLVQMPVLAPITFWITGRWLERL